MRRVAVIRFREVRMGHETLADDILRGLRAIARFTGDSKSRTAALCEAAIIPVAKERGLWIASKQRLREHYERLTAGRNSTGPPTAGA
jgi:hypothetical protein